MTIASILDIAAILLFGPWIAAALDLVTTIPAQMFLLRNRAGTAALVLSEQFAGFPVDEMEPGASKANHRRIGIGFVRCRDFWQPMLHGGAQSRAFKQDVSVHVSNMRRRRLRSPPYVCVGAARVAA